MSRLIAIYNVLNEEKTIRKSIELVLPYVDEVHVYDGAWAQYENVHHSSTDNTQKIVKSIDKNKVFWHGCRKTFDTQWDKRSKSLSCLKSGDYFLWLDGDEMVYNANKLKELPFGKFDIAWANCISNLYDAPYMIPRVIKFKTGMHYDGRHWWILDKNKELVVTHHDTSIDYVNIDTDISIWNLRQTRNGNKRNEYNEWVKAQLKVEEERSKWLLANTIDKSKLRRHGNGYKTNRNRAVVIRECDSPRYTMFAAMSRCFKTPKGNIAQRWFDRFDTMEIPENTELVFVLDNDSKPLRDSIEGKLRGPWGNKFVGIKFYCSDKPKAAEFGRGLDEDGRRAHILHNWHIALTEAQGEILLCAEDDTLPDRDDTYLKLAEFIENNPDCGFIQGTEVGRWEINNLACWFISTDNKGNPTKIVSSGKLDGIQECTAGGWYACAIRMDVARSIELEKITYLGGAENKYSEIGPDIKQTWEITKMGYKCYTDFDLPSTHVLQDGERHPHDDGLVIYERNADNHWNREFTPID